jgi:glutamine---fructose-6-phosphate transaminase (isomerizing)
MGVAATKTFTSQLALMVVLALALARAAGRPEEELEELRRELAALPLHVVNWLADPGPVEEVAARCADDAYFLYLGRHVGVPVAQEGALKLKEIAYSAADAYPAGEMKHGPIALLREGTPVVCILTDAHVADKLLSNVAEVRARGAHVIAVACPGDVQVGDVADDVLLVPRTHPMLQPVLSVLPLQLFAYHVARLRGLDVDQPRNLAKTVTVE